MARRKTAADANKPAKEETQTAETENTEAESADANKPAEEEVIEKPVARRMVPKPKMVNGIQVMDYVAER